MNNWVTTIAGIIAAIGLAGVDIPVCHDDMTDICTPYNIRWIFKLMAVAGTALLGVAAKQWNAHSTVEEVEKATELKEGESDPTIKERIERAKQRLKDRGKW